MRPDPCIGKKSISGWSGISTYKHLIGWICPLCNEGYKWEESHLLDLWCKRCGSQIEMEDWIEVWSDDPNDRYKFS